MDYGGAIYQSSSSQGNQRRCSNLRWEWSSSSSSSGLCARQRFDIDRCLVLRSLGGSQETGLQARPSCSWRAKTFLHLCLLLSWFLFGISLCEFWSLWQCLYQALGLVEDLSALLGLEVSHLFQFGISPLPFVGKINFPWFAAFPFVDLGLFSM